VEAMVQIGVEEMGAEERERVILGLANLLSNRSGRAPRSVPQR
jgi:hypothetical protein